MYTPRFPFALSLVLAITSIAGCDESIDDEPIDEELSEVSRVGSSDRGSARLM